MTNEHTAALKRARDSVRNAREILASVTAPWYGEGLTKYGLVNAEKLLSVAIDKEPAK